MKLHKLKGATVFYRYGHSYTIPQHCRAVTFRVPHFKIMWTDSLIRRPSIFVKQNDQVIQYPSFLATRELYWISPILQYLFLSEFIQIAKGSKLFHTVITLKYFAFNLFLLEILLVHERSRFFLFCYSQLSFSYIIKVKLMFLDPLISLF